MPSTCVCWRIPAAVSARAGREAHGDRMRIDVALFRIPGATGEIRDVEKRVPRQDLRRSRQFIVDAQATKPAGEMLEFLHSLPSPGEKETSHDMRRDRLSDLLLQPPVESEGVGLQCGEVGVGRLGMHVRGRVPCRARSQFAPLQQQDIGLPGPCQVVKDGDAHDAPADDDDSCCHGHGPGASCFRRCHAPCNACCNLRPSLVQL